MNWTCHSNSIIIQGRVIFNKILVTYIFCVTFLEGWWGVYSPNFPLPRLLLIFGSQNYQIYFIFLRVQNFEGTLSKHWQVKKKNYIFLLILNQNLAAVNCTGIRMGECWGKNYEGEGLVKIHLCEYIMYSLPLFINIIDC